MLCLCSEYKDSNTYKNTITTIIYRVITTIMYCNLNLKEKNLSHKS